MGQEVNHGLPDSVLKHADCGVFTRRPQACLYSDDAAEIGVNGLQPGRNEPSGEDCRLFEIRGHRRLLATRECADTQNGMSVEPWMLRTALVFLAINGINALLFWIAHRRHRSLGGRRLEAPHRTASGHAPPARRDGLWQEARGAALPATRPPLVISRISRYMPPSRRGSAQQSPFSADGA